MTFEGMGIVAGQDVSSLDLAKGVRTCLTYGLALACDAVFVDGKAAFARIGELTAIIGPDDVLLVLKDNLGSIGKLRETGSCAMPGMDLAAMRMMVFQMQILREIQDGMIKAEETSAG